jgi:hypothetical protein
MKREYFQPTFTLTLSKRELQSLQAALFLYLSTEPTNKTDKDHNKAIYEKCKQLLLLGC